MEHYMVRNLRNISPFLQKKKKTNKKKRSLWDMENPDILCKGPSTMPFFPSSFFF